MDIRMKRALKTGAIVALMMVAVGVALRVVLPWLIPNTEVDQCLDHGGCWDRERNRCEMADDSRCHHG